MATNEKNFKIKKGLTIGDGITVETGIVDFTDATEILGITSDNIQQTVKNVSAGTLTKGTVVYQSGTTGTIPEVQAADNTNSSTMPAIGVLNEDLTAGAEGVLVVMGKVSNMDTSSFTAGQTLYVGTSGALTATVPTGQANLIQNIGKVLKVHASSGGILVTGAGRSNATPNLDENNIFVGNATNQTAIVEHTVENVTDVTLTSLAHGEILKYDSASQKWVNGALPAYESVNHGSSTSTTTATSEVTVFQFDKTTIDSAEVAIRAKDGTAVHITKLLIVHDGTTATATEYGETLTGSSLVTYDVSISGNYVQLLATPASANSTSYAIDYSLVASDTIYTSSTATSATTQTAIYTFDKSANSGAELLISVVDTTTSETSLTKMIVVHDGTTATATEYGNTNTDAALATYDVDISGSSVRLLATPGSANAMTHRVKYTLI